jgi:hypothetical protein
MNEENNSNPVPKKEEGEGCASILLKIVVIGFILAVLAFGTCLLMLRH